MENPNTPIVNAGIKYVNGLNIKYVNNKIISMEPGASRNSTNTNDIILNSMLSINGQKVGVNGVDVAPIIANKFYAVYIIGDSNNYKRVGGLLSLNYVQPNLPTGYDMYQRVGWVYTNGSINIVEFFQYGNGQNRNYHIMIPGLVLVSSSATTFTPINLGLYVPPIETNVLFNVIYFANGNFKGNADFLPFGVTVSTSSTIQFGYGVSGQQIGMITVPCKLDLTVPKILYKVTSGDLLSLACAGFEDYIF
jgi:hypothetical protein